MKKTPFNKDLWTGRIDSEDGDLGLRIHQVINDYFQSFLVLRNCNSVLQGNLPVDRIRS